MRTRETTRQFDRSHGSFELAMTPLILGLIGLWIDHKVGTTPLFVISLAMFGLIGAGMKVFFTYRYEMEQHAAKFSALRAGHTSGSVEP